MFYKNKVGIFIYFGSTEHLGSYSNALICNIFCRVESQGIPRGGYWSKYFKYLIKKRK
jgi:hypothetical protein